jgi:hypothetical protein
MPQRVVVFVDAQNVYKSIREQFDFTGAFHTWAKSIR